MSNTKAANAIVEICRTVIEAVEASGAQGVPEGHLYAMMMPMGCNLDQFQKLISLVIGTGKVKKRGHLLLAA